MRLLYLDDSGKLHPNDRTRFVVFGGFSVDEKNWHKVTRQIAGAKGNFFNRRGQPDGWEIKSDEFLPRGDWVKPRKRRFCFELVDILKRNECHVYAISLNKAKARDTEETLVPVAFQVLMSKFCDEVTQYETTGSIVCDWSTHKLDRHVTRCVNTMVISHEMFSVLGGVSYASSEAMGVVQVADLIAGTARRRLEGRRDLEILDDAFAALRYKRDGGKDIRGYPVDSIVNLF